MVSLGSIDRALCQRIEWLSIASVTQQALDQSGE